MHPLIPLTVVAILIGAASGIAGILCDSDDRRANGVRFFWVGVFIAGGTLLLWHIIAPITATIREIE